MSKMVHIVGQLGTRQFKCSRGAEVWGCNTAVLKYGQLTRLYLMDHHKYYPPNFAEIVNKWGGPVVARAEFPGIERQDRYPLQDAIMLSGRPYFTSSIAYMIAHAILQGYERINLYGMYRLPASADYMAQKPCLDYWIGLAIGRGIKVEIDPASDVAKPYPWQPDLYGYQVQRHEHIAQHVLGAVVGTIMAIPTEFIHVVDDAVTAGSKVDG